MTSFESEKLMIKNQPEVIYNFLADFNNFHSLLPEQVINWKSTTDTCSFTIKGMTDLAMCFEQKIPSSKLVMIPDGKTPMVYKLIMKLNTVSPHECEAQIIFEAELNAMMSMMASKPLKNFVNILVTKLKEKFEQ